MKARRILSVVLQTVGAAAIVLSIALCSWFFLALKFQRVAPFDKDDLVFVLNIAGADPAQSWSIIQSSRGERSFTGDHFDYACIQLTEPPQGISDRGWRTAPEDDPVLLDALDYALRTARSEGASCMPAVERANSANVARNVLSLYLIERVRNAVEVALFEPSSNRLYYISEKT